MDALLPAVSGLQMGMVLALSVMSIALAWRLLAFPDISVEGSFVIGGAAYAALLKHSIHPALAIAGGVTLGAAAGAVTGVLHARYGVNRFLAGILVAAASYTIALRLMAAPNIGLLQLGVESALTAWLPLTAIVIAVATVSTRLAGSDVGLESRAAGANPEFARSLGINVPLAMAGGLAATNALSAIAGILLVSHQRFADVGMSQGMLVVALAGMAIGERLVPERALSFQLHVVVAAVVGSVTYHVAVAYALAIGVSGTDLKLVTASFVLFILAIGSMRPPTGVR